MRAWGRFGYVALFLVGLVLTLKITGCSTANLTSNTMPLAAVAPLENPKLPDWIEQISPLGEANPTAQIRVRFKEALIPVEQLESKDQQALLEKFALTPPLPGKFRFLTPRMVGFQADQATPKATRVQVTLKAGLADLKNHRLDKDLTWTFNTEPIKLSNLPGSPPAGTSGNQESSPFDIKPVLKITSNTELDPASLQESWQLTALGQQNSVPLKVEWQQEETKPAEVSPEETFDVSDRTWTYIAEPRQTLAKATRYQLKIVPGLRSAKGNMPSESVFASQIETYSPLAFQKLGFYGQPDAGGA
ncbi:MAG: alpha-2-macroglobulin family protein, partial [Kovacikia sp.]